MHSIVWTKSVAKELRKLPKGVVALIVDHVERLGADPRPAGAKKLKGPKNLYRVRQGDYRIIYQITNGQLVLLIVEVGHRREIYRDL